MIGWRAVGWGRKRKGKRGMERREEARRRGHPRARSQDLEIWFGCLDGKEIEIEIESLLSWEVIHTDQEVHSRAHFDGR
jgi:hypothetical protein